MAKKNNFLNKNYPLIISYVIIKLCQNNNKKFNFPCKKFVFKKIKTIIIIKFIITT